MSSLSHRLAAMGRGTPPDVAEPYRVGDLVEVVSTLSKERTPARVTAVTDKAVDVRFDDGRTGHVGKHRARPLW